MCINILSVETGARNDKDPGIGRETIGKLAIKINGGPTYLEIFGVYVFSFFLLSVEL